ncbi:hypothetical protein MMC18_000249 [Xylographa bjoerkii]|nr:hypothetical protein [Xylographa bjoerkii]
MSCSVEKDSIELGTEGSTSSRDRLLTEEETKSESGSQPKNRQRWVLLLTSHFVLLILNILLFAVWLNYPWKGRLAQDTIICKIKKDYVKKYPCLTACPAPAVEAIRYESQYFDEKRLEEIDSPYVGEPREELDQAWHEHLQNSNVAVPAETMRDLGRLDDAQSILLPDGSGYLTMIFAYHQLHCIKRLHHALYPTHYFPNLTAAESRDQSLHNAHCLDLLRQTVMCNGDVSLITMHWGHTQRMPLGNFSAAHSCRDWSAIDAWAGEHSPKRLMEPGWLVNPTFGPVIDEANRHERKLGVTHDW